MKITLRILAILSFTTVVLLTSCSQAGTVPSGNSVSNSATVETHTYKSVGIIKSVDTASGKVTVDHEDIPGYMPPMEMTEPVADRAMLDILKPGDKVEFDLLREGSKLTFTRFTKIGEVVNGGEIYKMNCAECHGANGEGAKKGIPLTKGHAIDHTETEHIKQVSEGDRGKMPAFRDKLTPEQIAAVVKYVREVIQKNIKPEKRGHHH